MITEANKFGCHAHKTTPYAHQAREFEKSKDLKEYGLWWEMGTGKSKPIIDTAAHLFLTQEIDGLVIVSDKGAYLNWYRDEVPKHMPNVVPYRMAYWSSSATRQEQEKLKEITTAADDKLDIMCVNVESLSSPRAVAAVEQFIRSHYCMMVVDESTSIKNPKAERTKSCIALGRLCDYRRVMTGTPITQSPLDVWSQCEFLRPASLGFPTFTSFRAFHANMTQVVMGPRRFMQITGYRNLDKLTERLNKFSSRILKSECLDLPEKIYETAYVEMTPEQMAAYESLKRTAVFELEQGLLTSTNALTTVNKLQQIVCGHIKLDNQLTVDLPNNRIPMLLDKLEEIPGKVLIWCAYQRDVELIVAAIANAKVKNKLDGYPVHYYGKTSDKDRGYHLELFRNDPRCKWFVGTAATGGKGLTLVEACTTIYFSNSYSLEDRLQSEDRNHRIGQRNNVVYIDMVSPRTIDEKIVGALKRKEDLAHQVLDRFRELITP